MTDQPTERPIDTLIRRANSYAHHEYCGQGLADCIADNHQLAEEAEAAVGAAIAQRIRAELVCCQQYDETHDGLTQEQMERAVDELWKSPRFHAICFWGEAAARLAEGRSDDREPPSVEPGRNAEDCPACDGVNVPYPFICPGHSERNSS